MCATLLLCLFIYVIYIAYCGCLRSLYACVYFCIQTILLFYLLQGLTITGMYMYIALSEICDDVLECAVLLLPMSSYTSLLCYGSPAGVRCRQVDYLLFSISAKTNDVSRRYMYNLFYDVMASDRLQLHGETAACS